MKKLFKGFAITLFTGASLLGGINAIETINYGSKRQIIKKTQSKEDNNNKQTRFSKNKNWYVYNLDPGQEFNPNSREFDDYWNRLVRFRNNSYNYADDSAWLMAVENVESKGDYWQINFYYSFYAKSFNNDYFSTSLTIYNDSFSKEVRLENIFDNYSKGNYSYVNDSVQIPKDVSDQNLTFDVSFRSTNWDYSMYTFESNYIESSFDLASYLNMFYINAFSVVPNSITNESFELLIDLKLTNGNIFIPYSNNLIVYSDLMPFKTKFIEYQGNLLKYQVSGLKADTVYNNFNIGILGFNGVDSLDNLAINTKISANRTNSVGVIVGSTIGGIILLLLILLIILLLLKRRKKVVEYNYYHNYRTFVDQQGNYIEMNQEEYDALDEDVAAQYEEVDTSELLDGHYEYQ